jgi:hypothetical protein
MISNFKEDLLGNLTCENSKERHGQFGTFYLNCIIIILLVFHKNKNIIVYKILPTPRSVILTNNTYCGRAKYLV